ncbi:MAG: hypothetical protein VX796_05720 [Pseudomonadota bacterium]|nr:hypothetical protein [Pseudomonadota bacterium]
MAYGAEIKNDDGEVIIDGSNPCAFLHYKKTLTATVNRRTNSRVLYRNPIIVAFDEPITTDAPPFILAYAHDEYLTMGVMSGGPGNWLGFSCFVPWLGPSNYGSSSVTFTIEYAVFSTIGDFQSNDAYGMQIFSSNGEQVFDSRKFPFVLDGNFEYKTYAEDMRGLSENSDLFDDSKGRIFTTPSERHLPLLSGLNELLFFGYNDRYYGYAKAAIKRIDAVTWKFNFGVMYIFLNDITFGNLGDDDVPLHGGGQGATNMFLFAQCP